MKPFLPFTSATFLSYRYGQSAAISGDPKIQPQFGKYIIIAVAVAFSASTQNLLQWEPLEILKQPKVALRDND